MKIRDIVELAAVLLQNNELINTNVFWHRENENNEYVQKVIKERLDLQQLIRCANLIVKEVACDFIPLTFRQIIKTESGTIPYTKFEKPLLSIKSIKDLNGETVTAYTMPNYLAIEEGTFAVTYNYIPSDKEFFEDIDFKGDKASDRIFAYGTASEYCLINGDYDNALYWERRYKDALYVHIGKDTKVIMPKRRWI